MALPPDCREYLHQLIDPCLILDANLCVIGANPAWLRLVGADDEDELVGALAGERSPEVQPDGTPSDLKAAEAARTVLEEGHLTLPWTAYGPAHQELQLEISASRVTLNGETWIHLTAHDISHRIRIEDQLREQSRFQKMVSDIAARFIHGSADDLDAATVDALRRSAEHYGADRAWVFVLRDDNTHFDQTHEWHAPGIPPLIDRFQSIPVSAFPTLFDCAFRGEPFCFSDIDEMPDCAVEEREECQQTGIQSILALPLMTGGTVYGMMGVEVVRGKRTWSDHEIALLRVIPELIAASFARWRTQEQLQRLADTDGLTGLANRRQFDETLRREYGRLARQGGHLSLILFDIDAFKPYNDYYGHLAGDDCLRAIARTVSQIPARTADRVARYGGEEFACIAPDTEIDGARLLAERMREAIAALRIEHQDHHTGDRITASFGVASVRCRPGGSGQQLVEAADQALYRGKARGGNCVEVIDLDEASPA